MIKLTTMTSVCPDWEIAKIISVMQELGYQGLEPRTGWNHAAGIETSLDATARDGIRADLEKAGLVVSCVASGARFAVVDDSEAEQYLAEARDTIRLASDLGAPYVRTFGGDRGTGEVYGMVKRAAERYKKVVDEAAEAGVTLLMETHDSWCVSAQVRAVIEEVDHPALKALWDIMHPQRHMERPTETMANIGQYTCHLHAHDAVYDEEGKTKGTALGDGLFDHGEPLRLLSAAEFSGHCSVEVIHKPGSDHDAYGVMKQYAEALRGLIPG